MSAAASLTAWGLPRADEIVELARATKLPLPIAATLLEKESGGRNVWGSDAVSTGGAYVKGGEVTRENYLAYRQLVRAGQIGRQGVGPGQLTYGGYQDEADRRGGCWVWRVNCAYSFEILADLQRRYGVRDGFRRYNGSGPMAERYADDAMTKLGRWTDRLGTAAPSPTPRPPAAPLEDDMTPDERAALFEVRDLLRLLKPGVPLPGRSAGLAGTFDDHFGWSMTAAGRADDAALGVREVLARLDAHDPAVQIDYAALARELIAAAKGA